MDFDFFVWFASSASSPATKRNRSLTPPLTPPVISQWAIFAIRNLLERNAQNQELVAGLERSGTADYSALRQLGFEVEERDGSLLLKPLRKDS